MTNDALVDRRAARLARLLAATDAAPRAVAFPASRVAEAQVRRVRASVMRWRIAAAIAVLGFGLSLVPPVRAWIAERARAVLTLVVPPTEVPAATVPAPLPGNRVLFAPGPETFTIHVTARQSAGRVAIVTADAPDAAYITNKPGDAEVVVLPDGLRIVTSPAADASYTVRVPASLKRIQVRIGSEAIRTFVPERAGERFLVELM